MTDKPVEPMTDEEIASVAANYTNPDNLASPQRVISAAMLSILANTIVRLLATIDSLEAKVEEQASAIMDLACTVSGHEVAIALGNVEYNSLRAENERLKQDYNRVDGKLQQSGVEYCKLQAQLTAEQEAHGKTKLQMGPTSSDFNKIETDLRNAHALSANQRNTICSLQGVVDSLRKKEAIDATSLRDTYEKLRASEEARNIANEDHNAKVQLIRELRSDLAAKDSAPEINATIHYPRLCKEQSRALEAADEMAKVMREEIDRHNLVYQRTLDAIKAYRSLRSPAPKEEAPKPEPLELPDSIRGDRAV